MLYHKIDLGAIERNNSIENAIKSSLKLNLTLVSLKVMGNYVETFGKMSYFWSIKTLHLKYI